MSSPMLGINSQPVDSSLRSGPALPYLNSLVRQLPQITPPGFHDIASHLFVPNWNPSDIVLSNEEPISDALETVLTAKRKVLSDRQKENILNEIYFATNSNETVGALRDLPDEDWKNLRGIPVICRIYLKHLVENSVNLSFRELLECDFHSGTEFNWDKYSDNLAHLLTTGFAENECLEALVVSNNAVSHAMEFLLVSHAQRRTIRERAKKERGRAVPPKSHHTVVRMLEEQKQADPVYRWSRMSSTELRIEASRLRSQILAEQQINVELSINLERLCNNRKLSLYGEFLRGLMSSGSLSLQDIQALKAYRDERGITEEQHVSVLEQYGLDDADLDAMKTDGGEGGTSVGGSSAGLSCLVCADLDRDHIILPCGHVCFCEECAELYDTDMNPNAECPLCRRQVEQVVKVFF